MSRSRRLLTFHPLLPRPPPRPCPRAIHTHSLAFFASAPPKPPPPTTKNNDINHPIVSVLGPGKARRDNIPIADALALLDASTQDLILLDDKKQPPLCRIVTREGLRPAAAATPAAPLAAGAGGIATTKVRVFTGPRNDQIDLPPSTSVLCIGPTDSERHVMTLSECRSELDRSRFDLVLVNGKGTPPVCRVVDKKLEQEAREEMRKIAKKTTSEGGNAGEKRPALNHKNEIKEHEVNSNISPNDLGVKVKRMLGHLGKGYRVAVTIKEVKGGPNAAEVMGAIANGLKGQAKMVSEDRKGRTVKILYNSLK
ncbi:hypothetical protein HK101_002206 [Irineochytrium annulatum]|nr:hypothetical protein HK101_002206 [Irineochytrium annulatum]